MQLERYQGKLYDFNKKEEPLLEFEILRLEELIK